MTLTILMFCPQFRPIIGGAERQAEKLAKALVAEGVMVKILTPQYSLDVPLKEDDEGLEIIRFPLFNLYSYLPLVRGLGVVNLLSLQLQVRRAVASHLNKTDLLHTHIASPMTAFAMQAANRSGVPVICKIASASNINDFSQTDAIGFFGKLICSLMVKRMTMWIAITKSVVEVLKQWKVPEELIVSIPNGVEIPKKRKQRTLCPVRKFLYLGRLSAKINRDVSTVIQAFDRLADVIPDAELALVGDGDKFQETAELVANCRHQNRIKMPGFQEPEPWLLWADCFVLPSRREGLSNALLEAMSYGLPCIVNDIPPNREVLKDGEAGLLVPVEDMNKLFSAMTLLTEDTSVASVFGHAAFQRVKEKYSIESVAKQYVSLYKNLIAPL